MPQPKLLFKTAVPSVEDGYLVWRGEDGFRHGHGPQKCPFGRHADVLWARESWRLCEPYPESGYLDEDKKLPEVDPRSSETLFGFWKRRIEYRVDSKDGYPPAKWRSAALMPRWASRFGMTVLQVRVEQLQDISDTGALAEGVLKEELGWDPDNFHPPHSYGYVSDVYPFPQGRIYVTPKEAFQERWDASYAKPHHGDPFPWASNPWVYVVEFEKVAT